MTRTIGRCAVAQKTEQRTGEGTLAANELRLIDAYWRAANYLSVGQIYLLDNPLLREPLRPEHVKPRLLGHWGTTPGLNFVYAHMNRAIRNWDLDAIYIMGPGHGGPAAVANAYLEGTYSEVYPNITQDEEGLRKLFRQFSFPGGIPSHVAPETPGSIHEGGELGYALSHAYGAAFDNPDLLVCCIVGDGEAETGPLATAWHSNKFLNPVTDGAVLPILHLNGYKIANPTVLARIGDDELTSLLEGYGHTVHWVDGDEPEAMHQRMAAVLDAAVEEIATAQRAARIDGETVRPRWPMIILRTPKGWTGPKTVDGLPTEGTWRSHQVPMAELRTNPEHLALLESWLESYRPEELFDERGVLVPELTALPPKSYRRMSANPNANGGLLLRDLVLPDFRDYAVEVTQARHDLQRGDPRSRRVPARRRPPQSRPVPPVRPGRDRVQPPGPRLRGHRPRVGGRDPSDRRPPRPRRPGDGGALRAPVPGVARGLPAHRSARPLQLLRGVHPHHRLDVQPAREVAEDDERHSLAPAARLPELPALVARLAARPQRLLPSGPRIHRPRREQESRGDPRLPAAGRQLPPVGRRPLPAQPPLRERDRRRETARAELPLDGGRRPPLHARNRDLGVGLERRGRPRRGDGVLRRHPDARDARGRRRPSPRAADAQDAGGQRRRPDAAAARHRASSRPLRPRLRHPLHDRQACCLRLPRLSVADPPVDLPPHEPLEHPRARLQGGGHDHDPVRHGHAQRPRPVPPRDGRDRPRAHRSARGLPRSGSGWQTNACAAAPTRASTARTRPPSATGPGPISVGKPMVRPRTLSFSARISLDSVVVGLPRGQSPARAIKRFRHAKH